MVLCPQRMKKDNYTCQGNQTQTGTSIGGVAMTTGWKKGDTISYTYDNATGKVTIAVGAGA